MKSIETVVGEMLMHYCDAIIQAKGKSYSRAGKIWKDQIHVDLATSFHLKKPRSRLRKARAR
jgi:hypothetical protein